MNTRSSPSLPPLLLVVLALLLGACPLGRSAQARPATAQRSANVHQAKHRPKQKPPHKPARRQTHGAQRVKRGNPCPGRKAVARLRDTPASLAKRFFLTESEFRAINDLREGAKVKRGRRYWVAKGSVGERLEDGVSMGPSTPNYIVVNPSRAWGRRWVVALLQRAAAAVQSAYPAGHRIVFEDLSFQMGGCMRPHSEHRGGREVDAGLYLQDKDERPRLRAATAESLDAERTWRFLSQLIQSGCVERILLDRRLHPPLERAAEASGVNELQLNAWFERGRRRAGVIRHAGGHNNHAHIRFVGTCAPTIDSPEVPPID